MARRWARYGLLLATLVAGLAVGLSFGSNAYAGTVCSTTGDVSFCAQWGVMGFATRLQVKNTGSQTISSFTFALPSGVTVGGAAGNTGCHAAQPAANDVTCSTPIAPGQQQFVDILSTPTPAVGSTGTLTLDDSGGTAQPAQTLTLDPSAVCGLAAAHIALGCTTGTTSTTAGTKCHCTRLRVALSGFKEKDNRAEVVFYLDWRLDCARGDTRLCEGVVFPHSNIEAEAADHHLRLSWHPRTTSNEEFVNDPVRLFLLTCGSRTGAGCTVGTADKFFGRVRFELFGHPYRRENLTLTWEMYLFCEHLNDQTLRMKFDSHGNLDAKASQLGKL